MKKLVAIIGVVLALGLGAVASADEPHGTEYPADPTEIYVLAHLAADGVHCTELWTQAQRAQDEHNRNLEEAIAHLARAERIELDPKTQTLGLTKDGKRFYVMPRPGVPVPPASSPASPAAETATVRSSP